MSDPLQAAEERLAGTLAEGDRAPSSRNGLATGRVQALIGSNTSPRQAVMVTGVTFELTRGDDWSGAFQLAVTSLGQAVVGRLVVLAYLDGQPMILDLMGVTSA